jgi:hypothetical protein
VPWKFFVADGLLSSGIMPIKIRLGNVLGSNRFFGLGSTEKRVEMGELQ